MQYPSGNVGQLLQHKALDFFGRDDIHSPELPGVQAVALPSHLRAALQGSRDDAERGVRDHEELSVRGLGKWETPSWLCALCV